jgi:hypothetical protein
VRIDVHQHLLPEPLIAALVRRAQAPRVRRASEGLLLEVAGEPPSLLDPSQHDPHLRARRAGADGLDRALISLSSVLGIEALPPDEGAELLAAWEEGVRELPPALGHWGAVSLTDIDPAAVDRQLDGGAAGISLPAGALTTDAGLDRVLPLLERLQQRGAALFVHPGPDPWAAPPATASHTPWLPALTRYVAEMNGAWHSFATLRHRLPHLRVVFAMLAGLAPLHVERLHARGGPASAVLDSNSFYDTSSYGPRAVRAVAAVVGDEQLAFGSDYPVLAAA